MDALVRLIGFPATLIHNDTLVLDRWNWIKKRLPRKKGEERPSLLDVGCGSGAFTIGSALRGYKSHGLSWDRRNNDTAENRARICGAKTATFSICDVRGLDKEKDLYGRFDYIICAENIEHIINDKKLMTDMNRCLGPGGRLLLTTPNIDFIPIHGEGKSIAQPPVEDGGHVIAGYSAADLKALCDASGFDVQEISFCSGYLSQKITGIMRRISRGAGFYLAWALVLPLRILPPIFDRYIKYTGYSICLVAVKK